MFCQRIWDAMPTSRRAREREAAAQRECALKEEFARRVRGLESQILSLRAENRALLNSVLGIAGIPPIMVTDPAELLVIGQEPKQIPRTACRAPENLEQSNSAPDSAPDHSSQNVSPWKPRGRGANDGRIVAPMRRRSWRQIYRTLELESLRRKSNDQQGTT
jgi:hypothetical protein